MAEVQKKITDTSPSSASTAAGDVLYDVGGYDSYVVTGYLVGATGGTLDVYLQDYDEANSKWVDWIHFTQLASGASAVVEAYSPALSNTKTTVGTDTSPALSSGTCRGGPPRNKVRALYVAGASTSAGAAIVITLTCTNSRQ
jgi:hypothetical protein